MFPAFKLFGYSNITLAKSDNAMLSHWTQLWLLKATHNDTSSMLTQIEEFRLFIAQNTTSSGRGLSSMTCDKADRSTQIHATKAYVAESTNKCTWYEVTKENNNLHVFVSASGARHRPLKRKSIEGKFVNKN